jgi:PAS domain S-box-containing protein/putative nucleotidyltransferase with HDIG domain
MKPKLSALILEDNPADVELMLREIRNAGFEVEAQRVEKRADFLELLDPFLDIILADYTLPQFNALEALHLLQARGLDIPFIVVTGTISEEIAVECMKQGAADYLIKDRLARLGPAITHALHEKSLRDAKQKAELDLRESEERYRLLVEFSPEAIYVHDGDKIIYANPSAAELVGVDSPKDLIHQPVFDFFHPGGRKSTQATNPSLLHSKGHNPLTEYRFIREDGKAVDVEVRTAPITYEGKPAIQTIVRDISERKQRERELEALVSVSTVLRVAYTRDDIPPVLIDRLMELLGADTVGVLIVDAVSGDLVLEEAEGEWETALDFILAVGKIAKAEILDTGVSNLIYTVKDEDKFESLNYTGEIKAIACVPLVAQGELLGILCVGRKTSIEKNEVQLVTAISDMAANALLRATTHEKLETTFIETVIALAKTLDARDTPTSDHSHRVATWAQKVMEKMGGGPEDVQAVRWGALLHDIGKIGVPDHILLKPGPLTAEEWKIMERHAEIGAEIVAPVEKLANVAPIIRSHQEKYDGSGYPDALAGEDIPIGARIIAVVDAYSAMTENRIYRRARSHEKAVEELVRCSGTDFDPEAVRIFLNVLEEDLRGR